MLNVQAQWRRGAPQSSESGMILMRRSLKECRSYKSNHCKLLLVMTHSHSPPVCADLTAAPLQLYAFSVQNVKTQPMYRRGLAFYKFCSHLKDTILSSPLTLVNYSISPSRAKTLLHIFPWKRTRVKFSHIQPRNKCHNVYGLHHIKMGCCITY